MDALPCRHLRTKKMFTASTPAEVFEAKEPGHPEASPCHFWCNLTQSLVGADGRAADREACGAGRSCFRE